MKKLLIIALLVVGCDYAPTEHTHDTETLQHGCLDSQATNYDSTVVIDNNSCEFKQGCLDSLALNYDSTAVLNNNSCEFQHGCLDSLALNYDSTALIDNNSCEYEVTCMAETIGCDESEDFSLYHYWGGNNSQIDCEITIINTGQDTLSTFRSSINLKNYNNEGLLNIKNYSTQQSNVLNAYMVPNDTLNKQISFEIDRYLFTRCIDGSNDDHCELEFNNLVEFTISHTVICY